MILNLVDSTITALPTAPANGALNVRWHIGSPLSTSLPPQTGNGSLQLMRIIAPHRDIALLCDILNRSLPLLRRYFAQGGVVEIYGAKEPGALAGSLGHNAVVPPGGGGLTLQSGSGPPTVNIGPGFAINASGDPIKLGGGASGVNIGGRVVTVGGGRGTTVGNGSTTTVGGGSTITVGRGSTTTVGGGRTITVGDDSTITVGGSSTITVGGNSTITVGGSRGITVVGSSTITVGGSLPPDLARAVRGALCLLVRL